MTQQEALYLLNLTNSLCDSERGRLFTAVLKYIACGEMQEPRGTERVFFKQLIDVQMCNDVQMRNINNNTHNNLSTQVSTQERNNTTSFDTFWSAYPTKVNKKRTADIWKKLNPDEELVKKMLSSIEAWKRTRQWRDGYVPYPDTWLRGEKWNDEIPTEPKPRSGKKNSGYANRMVTMDMLSDIIVDLDAQDSGIGGFE